MKRSALQRTSWMKRGMTPLAKRNDARRAKVAKRRAKDRRSNAELDARAAGWIRAGGICECGCGTAFGEHALDVPHYHHTNYRKHAGIWVRRRCHEVIELRDFPHRERHYRHG